MVNYDDAGLSRVVGASAKGPEKIKEPEVPSHLDMLRVEVECLVRNLATLRTRLDPVINENFATGGSGTDTPLPVLCPVANNLRVATSDLADANRSIEAMLSSLEL